VWCGLIPFDSGVKENVIVASKPGRWDAVIDEVGLALIRVYNP